MADRPILFQAAMVRAQREDRKTQTRRLPTRLLRFGKITEFGPSDTPGYDWHFRDKAKRWHDLKHDDLLKVLPWQKGDRLWVRETWRTGKSLDEHSPAKIAEMAKEAGYRQPWCPLKYEADGATLNADVLRDFGGEWGKTRVAIHMPRWASRLTLTVTDVRVQRLREISEADCIAEGPPAVVEMRGLPGLDGAMVADPAKPHVKVTPRCWYRELWDTINGDGSWDANPWIVALTFTVDKRNIDAIEKAAA